MSVLSLVSLLSMNVVFNTPPEAAMQNKSSSDPLSDSAQLTQAFKANFHRLCRIFPDVNKIGNQSYSTGQKRFNLASFYDAIKSGEMQLRVNEDGHYNFVSREGNSLHGMYEFFLDGSLRYFQHAIDPAFTSLSDDVNLPAVLSNSFLETYAQKAIELTIPPISPGESITYQNVQLYAEPMRPRATVNVNRYVNGIKWGPGGWARVILEDFSGRVEAVRYYSRINGFEPLPSVRTADEDQQGAAAQEILTRYQLDQVTYGQKSGEFMTNASFLGGFLKNNPRTEMLRTTNTGVLASQFTFGDPAFPNRYSAVTDVLTGQTLSLGSYVPLGPEIGKVPVKLPSSKAVYRLFQPGVKKHPEFKLTETKKSKKNLKGEWVLLRSGKTFFKAQKLSNNRYRIQSKEFLVQ